jgi:hypothetical protein
MDLQSCPSQLSLSLCLFYRGSFQIFQKLSQFWSHEINKYLSRELLIKVGGNLNADGSRQQGVRIISSQVKAFFLRVLHLSHLDEEKRDIFAAVAFGAVWGTGGSY